MSVQISSTTDSQEAVTAASGGLAHESKSDDNQSASTPKEIDETNEESDTSKLGEQESESDDNDSEIEQEEDSQSKDDDKRPKKKSGFKKRIDKLTTQKTLAEQERDYWKAKALEQKPADKPEVQKPMSVEASEGRPKADDFETHEEYVEAVAEWKYDQRKAKEETLAKQNQAKSDYETKAQSYMQKARELAQERADFDDVMDDVDDIRVPVAVQELLLDAENGPEIAYELAKNRDEFARICSLSPIAAAREFGKFEAKLLKSSSVEKTEEIKKITKAPPPPKPIGSKGTAVAKSLDDMDYDEYRRTRDEQIKKTNRR